VLDPNNPGSPTGWQDDEHEAIAIDMPTRLSHIDFSGS
jgi:hypothetical protein